jgi:hypothetical protein
MNATRQYQPGHDLLRNKAHCAAVLEYFMGLPADLPREQLPSTQDLMMDGRFGIRPPNRINDLIHAKHDGVRYDFERIACGRGVYRWRLHYPARPGYPKHKNQTVLTLDVGEKQESPYMKRIRQEQEQAAPLFAQVRP